MVPSVATICNITMGFCLSTGLANLLEKNQYHLGIRTLSLLKQIRILLQFRMSYRNFRLYSGVGAIAFYYKILILKLSYVFSIIYYF